MNRHNTASTTRIVIGLCCYYYFYWNCAEAFLSTAPQRLYSSSSSSSSSCHNSARRTTSVGLHVPVSPTSTTATATTATPCSSSLPSFPLGSTIELTDPVTGCQVILLGCFHGSQSSAMDVTHCLSQPLVVDNKNDKEQQQQQQQQQLVVALELCASRFEDLRNDVLKQREQQQQQQQSQGDNKNNNNAKSTGRRPWMVRFVDMVQKTVQQRGWSTGIAAALLGGVSGIQTSMSGLQPGLEFQTALEHVLDHNDQHHSTQPPSSSSSSTTMIVLADQNVDETLSQVGQVPYIAMEMWKEFVFKHSDGTGGDSWKNTFGKEADALARAVGLLSCEQPRVTLAGFITRSPSAIRDMIRMTIPPILALQGSLLSVNAAFEWIHQQESLSQQQSPSPDWIMDAAIATVTEAAVAPTTTAEMTAAMTDDASPALVVLLVVLSTVVSLIVNYGILFVGYISLALPAVRVILRERDIILTQGIQQACHLATLSGQRPGRVVAVLGLLHVNGVAQQLLSNNNSNNNNSQNHQPSRQQNDSSNNNNHV